MENKVKNRFRLLAEYHSFLYDPKYVNYWIGVAIVSVFIHSYSFLFDTFTQKNKKIKVSVSLWSIIHSYH